MNILISGFCGKMGQTIYNLAKNSSDFIVTEGFDREESIKAITCGFDGVNLISDFSKSKKCDVVIDFSHISVLPRVLDFCVTNKKPLVLATTGLSEEDEKKVLEASKVIPIFKSSNMSEGVFVLLNLIKNATKMLNNWDIEIVEKHHNLKKDAPSGTAKMMFNEIKGVRDEVKEVFGRNPSSNRREPNEVGIHAVRGGGVVGEHEVEFFNEFETIKISHEAFSKNIFAEGALKASKFIVAKNAGLYTMKNLFE